MEGLGALTGSPAVATGGVPLVSVVMPAYNSGAFIRDAVASVLDQSHQAIELIVVDDGSRDRVDWVVELDPRRVRYQWKENGGPSSARNAGARLARGEFLAFLDSDDLWNRTKVESQVAALRERAPAALAYGALEVINEAGKRSPPLVRDRPSGDVALALFMYNFIATSSVMVRRSCFEEMGGFDEALSWSEDYDLWMRIVERHEAVCVSGVIGTYRINSQGLSRNFERLHATELMVIERALARNARPEFARHLPERLGQFHFEFGYNYFTAGRFSEARRQFARSIRHRPFARAAWLYLLRAVGLRRPVNQPARRPGSSQAR